MQRNAICLFFRFFFTGFLTGFAESLDFTTLYPVTRLYPVFFIPYVRETFIYSFSVFRVYIYTPLIWHIFLPGAPGAPGAVRRECRPS